VVEAPAGLPLGYVLDQCAADPGAGVLVGGYHGKWLPPELAIDVPVSRAGLTSAGGTLGAGAVLTLGEDTCPIGEVAKVATYLASQSSGQCGPCVLGLPAVARSLAAIADGSGGSDAVEAARRGAGAVVRRGACAHPDGVYRFVASALEVFTSDIAAHVLGAGCGRPVKGVLPLPSAGQESRLEVDWTRCQGHALCSHIVPELIQTDSHGYPALLSMAVPPWMERDARRAVGMCPALALKLTPGRPAAPREGSRRVEPWPEVEARPSRESGPYQLRGAPGRLPAARPRRDSVPPGAGRPRGDRTVSGTVSEAWIEELSQASRR
jgi:ferredoxin